MNEITLRAYAKINLSLDTVGKREDGYHLLEMIMQEVGVYDLVTVTQNTSGEITLSTDVSYIPCGEGNIAYKACELMKKEYKLASGYHVHIKKRIPVAAGLAGGSTDAAAVMRAVNQLEGLERPLEELMSLSMSIGSDIAFCLKGGTALVEGIGEQYTPINTKADYWVLLVKPSVGMSTAQVFKTLKWDDDHDRPKTQALVKALEENRIYDFKALMGNTLESVTAKECHQIDEIKSKLMNYGALVSQMSGSGPTVFGLFKREDQAKKALKNMQKYYRESYLVRPVIGR